MWEPSLEMGLPLESCTGQTLPLQNQSIGSRISAPARSAAARTRVSTAENEFVRSARATALTCDGSRNDPAVIHHFLGIKGITRRGTTTARRRACPVGAGARSNPRVDQTPRRCREPAHRAGRRPASRGGSNRYSERVRSIEQPAPRSRHRVRRRVRNRPPRTARILCLCDRCRESAHIPPACGIRSFFGPRSVGSTTTNAASIAPCGCRRKIGRSGRRCRGWSHWQYRPSRHRPPKSPRSSDRLPTPSERPDWLPERR